MLKSIIKAGPIIAPGLPPEAGTKSMYTPHMSGFFHLYHPDELVENYSEPFFAFADLQSALRWWRAHHNDFQRSIFLWEALSTETHQPPPFVVKVREWPLWEEFWSIWRSGQTFDAEDWGGEENVMKRVPQGTVLCRDIKLRRLVDPAVYSLS